VQELALHTFVELLKSYRYSVGSEESFQRSLEQVLLRHRIEFLREHPLGRNCGRIDFYLPDHKFGIELKVKGSPTQVLRQMHRYAQCPDIGALILLTARARLAAAPATMNGRPLVAVAVWEGQL
jgi:hypothetical protein